MEGASPRWLHGGFVESLLLKVKNTMLGPVWFPASHCVLGSWGSWLVYEAGWPEGVYAYLDQGCGCWP